MAKKYRITYLPFFYKDLDAITNYIQSKSTSTIIICLKKYQIKAFTKNVDINYIITDIDHLFYWSFA